MADTQQHNSKTVKPEEPTPWYGLPFTALGHIVWIWVLLIIIEWACPLWGETVGQHAQRVFIDSLSVLDAEQPVITEKLMQFLKHSMQSVAPLLAMKFHGAFAFMESYWQGVVYVTLALVARVMLLFYSWPLFFLALFLGFFDGLITRQRRTAFVGRESETTHFYTRKMLPWIAGITGYLWLLLPGIWPVSPIFMLLPGVILVGVMTRAATASYKKYL